MNSDARELISSICAIGSYFLFLNGYQGQEDFVLDSKIFSYLRRLSRGKIEM